MWITLRNNLTMRIGRGSYLLALVVSGCQSTGADSAAPQHREESSPPAFLVDVTSWVMNSSVSHRDYQISVALPDGYSAQNAPYPVLFAADANSQFGTLVETARLASFAREIQDVIVVGIGYPRAGQGIRAAAADRVLDLTPTADQSWVDETARQAQAMGLPSPRASGGAATFLRFLRDELIPSIELTFNVSHEDRGWYGHSLGGLFGTYALLESDGLFTRFILGSPSLWWDHRALFALEESLAGARDSLPAKVFFSVGMREEEPKYPMVTDLRAFVKRLQDRKYRRLEMQVQYFEGENHGSVVPATISRGLRYVYAASPGTRAR